MSAGKYPACENCVGEKRGRRKGKQDGQGFHGTLILNQGCLGGWKNGSAAWLKLGGGRDAVAPPHERPFAFLLGGEVVVDGLGGATTFTHRKDDRGRA